LLAVAIVLVVSASRWAYGGGTVGLDDVLPLVAQQAQSLKTLSNVIERSGVSVDSVTCDAIRLGNHFGPLSGARVADYKCAIGKSMCVIEATTFVMLPKGKVIALAEFPALEPMPDKAYLLERLTKLNCR